MGDPGDNDQTSCLASGKLLHRGVPISLTYLLQTSLASRAIDGFSDENTRQGVIDALLQYFDTDTIWYV
jgi:ATP12 chaperone protein